MPKPEQQLPWNACRPNRIHHLAVPLGPWCPNHVARARGVGAVTAFSTDRRPACRGFSRTGLGETAVTSRASLRADAGRARAPCRPREGKGTGGFPFPFCVPTDSRLSFFCPQKFSVVPCEATERGIARASYESCSSRYCRWSQR